MYNAPHLLALGIGNLLRVTRVRYRLILVIFQTNRTQLGIRHVLHVNPAHFKRTLPLVLRPHRRIRGIIHVRNHLRHTAKMPTPIDAVEQIDSTCLLFALMERLIQTLVAVLRRAPNVVLDAAMNVILGIRLDDEETRHLDIVDLKVRRVILGHVK